MNEASAQEIIEKIRALLLADGGDFDDPHVVDAHLLAEVAELVGLRVERNEYGDAMRRVQP